MRISRIRRNRKSTEITVVVTGDEARALTFACVCESSESLGDKPMWDFPSDKEDFRRGRELLKQASKEGFNKAW